MPAKRKIKLSKRTNFWPCGSCRRNSLTECIFCESCQQWFHASCENLSLEDMGSLQNSQISYTCNQCFAAEVGEGPYNYQQGLTRLVQALPYGLDILSIASKRESRLLPEFEHYRKSVISSDFIEIDLNAKAILDKCNLSFLGKPSKTTGDGNCLFNAVSIALTGDEGYATELRLRTAVDMSMNGDIYKSRPDYLELCDHSPLFEDSLSDCCTDKEWSSIFTLMSLSIVIGKPIRSVFPPMNGVTDPTHLALSKVFWSQGKSEENLVILWSNQSICKGKWHANHFVPLLPGQHDGISASNTEQQPTSVSSPPPAAGTETSFHSDESHISTSTPVAGQKRKADFTITDKLGVTFKIYKADASLLRNNKQARLEAENDAVHDNDNDAMEVNTEVPEEVSDTIEEDTEVAEDDTTGDDNVLPVAANVKSLTKLHSYAESYGLIQSRENVQSVVPPGNKTNCYVLIDNTGNIAKVESNQRCQFYDDCGVWDASKGNTRKSILIRNENDGSLKEVDSKSGVYCVKRRVKGKVVWEPLEPQPKEEEVVIMSRYYTVLKRKEDFKKRVTFFYSKTDPEIGKVALYEYQGTQPVESATHGNAKKGNTYTRTNPETLKKIQAQVDSAQPRAIFKSLKVNNSMTGPRDLKVIHNVKQNIRREDGRKAAGNNIADEILEVLDMLNTHPYVQTVIHNKDKVPSIICYTEDQVLDLRHFLSNSNQKEPVGIDRTFNLGSFFVTALVYKNGRVLRKDTSTNPVFLGPVLLHKDATYATYKSFLEHVATAIDCDLNNLEMRMSDKMEFGTDDEKALTKAIDHVFPNATRLLCTKHLKDNVSYFIQNKVGMDHSAKAEVMDDIFGHGGIIDSDTTIEFETKSDALESKLKDQHPSLETYFSGKLKPRLDQYVFQPTRRNKRIKNWTNNNAESINNILKLTTNWKPQRTKELILKLYSVVELHFLDYRSSLHGDGNYMLTSDDKMYHIHDSVWRCKTQEEKRQIFLKFLKDSKRGSKSRLVTSKDGKFSVSEKAKGVAKKPGQRKRPRNERANKRK